MSSFVVTIVQFNFCIQGYGWDTLQNPSPRKISLKIEGVTKFKKIKLLHFKSYQCHNISWTIQDICSSYWLRVNWRMPVSELIDWFCMLEDVKIVLLNRKWNSVGFRGLHYPSIDTMVITKHLKRFIAFLKENYIRTF